MGVGDIAASKARAWNCPRMTVSQAHGYDVSAVSMVRRLLGPVVRFVARMRRDLAISLAIGEVGKPALARAGMLKTSPTHWGILEVSYLVGWWLIALGVAVFPNYKDEPLFYFPAIVALSVAWLVTMALYSQTLGTTDFSLLRPPMGNWGRLLEAMQKRRVEVPDVLRTDESKAEMDSIVPTAVPAVMPVVLLEWFRWLAVRAVLVALIGMIGVLVGPSLAGVHWWRGWSPVSFLYALSAPWVAILVGSLLIPTFVNAFLAGLRADRDLAAVIPPGDGRAPVADDATKHSKARPRARRTTD